MLHRPSPVRRRGVTAVEFALVAPVFFLFVLGAIEVGRGIMVAHQLTSAARDACRAGVIAGTDDAAIKKVATDALAAQGVTGVTATVKVNGTEANASTARTNDLLTVTVTVPVSEVTWVPGGSFLKGKLGGQFCLRRE